MDFLRMSDIIPPTKKPVEGGFYIAHVTYTEEEAWSIATRALSRRDPSLYGMMAGTYVVLRQLREYQDNLEEVWMSDTPFERASNEHVLHQAVGDVLIVGLGIGMLPATLCKMRRVKSVTVLELESQVIDLIEPHIRHPRLTIIQGDAYHPPFRGRTFDYAYLDIWPTVSSNNWLQQKILLPKYRNLIRPGGIATAWLKDFVQRAYNENNRTKKIQETY